jgi:peptide/nickel transport system permease protein
MVSAVDTLAVEPPGPPEDGPQSQASRRRRGRFSRRRGVLATVALGWLVLLVGMVVLAPVLPLPDPTEGGTNVFSPPLDGNLLGTDHLGRDVLSRTVYGARTSLVVAIAATAIALAVGVPLGLAAGFFGKKVDTVVVGLSDIMLAFPSMILLLVIAAMAGASVRNLIIGIAFIELATYIRITRANAIAFSQREFVSASRGLGARELRIAVREVLPNVVPAIKTYAIAAMGLVFLVEGALSFLGLGIQPPTPVWGSMIDGGRPHLERAPYLVLVPSIAMFLTILSFNVLAEKRPGADSRTARLAS